MSQQVLDGILKESFKVAKLEFNFFVKKKIRQIEGRSTMLNQNVNKLSRIFQSSIKIAKLEFGFFFVNNSSN